MDNKPENPLERYRAYPNSQREYEADGKKYVVTRYFTGEKDLNRTVAELAALRADRETGLKS